MERHSQVYLEFYELHRDSYDSIVYFFEHHQGAIRQLPLEEQLELLAEYLNACFETAQYHKYLAHVDELIESLIIYNVETIHGKDEYTSSIFRKSAALFNLERYEESTFLVKQLCRMNPRSQNARILYRRNLYQNLSRPHQILRHASAAGLLLTAVLTAVDVFGGRFIQSAWLCGILIVRNIVFVTSLLTLLVMELRIRWQVERA